MIIHLSINLELVLHMIASFFFFRPNTAHDYMRLEYYFYQRVLFASQSRHYQNLAHAILSTLYVETRDQWLALCIQVTQ